MCDALSFLKSLGHKSCDRNPLGSGPKKIFSAILFLIRKFMVSSNNLSFLQEITNTNDLMAF